MKKKIGIWFGGCSTEYEVSLQSASAVIDHINNEKYELILIGIDKEGNWYLFEGERKRIKEDTWCDKSYCSPAALSMDRELHGILVERADGIEKISLDAAFPILHGKNGEDGTIQGAIELAGIPLVGCNTLASGVCMEKDMAHRLVSLAGIKVPKAYTFSDAEFQRDWNQISVEAEKIGYPIFIKPVRAGSSFGITKVMEAKELKEAVKKALDHDSLCIMEETIIGREVGCAVLGSDDLLIGEVDEIELVQDFFDYHEKYTLETSSIHVPARIPTDKAEEIKENAKVIYRALGCSCFARVDMFLTEENEIYFNEVNTIPGFTDHSRYPNMMKAGGVSFTELVEGIIQQVLD